MSFIQIDADYSGFVSKSSKPPSSVGTIARGGAAMAKIFSEPSETCAPPQSYELPTNDSLLGGPLYKDLGVYKSSAQAANDGDPTERATAGKKKLTRGGPTVDISPVTGQPLCNYGDWAKKYDEANDPTAQPKPPRALHRPLKNPTIENLRQQLAARGATGIIGLGKKFRIMDDDGSGQLSKEEFKKGMTECALLLTDSELDTLFNLFDKDRSGSISFDEFLAQVVGEMNDRRLALVQQAFEILDTDGSGVVDVDEISSRYDASEHPDVLSGKRSERDVLTEFLGTFDVGGEKDGKVTFDEFVNYYNTISFSVPSDNYFELMIRNAWHISGGEGEAANSANLRVLVTFRNGNQEVVEVKNDLGIKKKTDPGYQRDLENRLRLQGLKNFRISKTDIDVDEMNKKKGPDDFRAAKERRRAEEARIKAVAEQSLEKLRTQLISRGASGIVGLQRKFRIMDDDGSKSLDKPEFKKALREMTIQLQDAEFEALFALFDRDKSGTITFEELLVAVRGPVNDKRRKLINMAFDILDTDKSGTIDAEEIASKYDASKHPDVVSGKKTPKEILLEFLSTFDVGGEVDGKVTRQEFENYYSNISAGIDDDVYFELMIRNAWHISGGEGDAQCTSNLRVLVTHSDGTQGVEEVKNDLGLVNKKEKGFQEQLMKRLSAQGLKDIKSANADGNVDDDDNGGQDRDINMPSSTRSMNSTATETRSNGTNSIKPAYSSSRRSVRGGDGGRIPREVSSRNVTNNSVSKKVKPAPPYNLDNPAPFISADPPRLDHPVTDKIRSQILEKFGVKGFVKLQRALKSNEENGSGVLDRNEFCKAIRDAALRVSDSELSDLFSFLDATNKGIIFSDAFLDDVRGTMSLSRKYVTHAAFDKLDDRWNGEIEPSVLMSNYVAAMHPLVTSGKKSESEILREFLENCDVGGEKTGKVTKREFENYHANLSASIEKDIEFEALMRAVWDLGDGPIQLRAQRAPTEPRIMRFRERSPSPPPRSVLDLKSVNDCLEEDSVSSFIMDQKKNALKMPQIGKTPNINSGRRGIFQRTETSTVPVDTITGRPLVNPPPRVGSTPPSRNTGASVRSSATIESKSESAILDDVKELKVKAMLSKNARNYVQSKVCLEEAYRLLVGLYTKNNVECKKLADQIIALDTLIAK